MPEILLAAPQDSPVLALRASFDTLAKAGPVTLVHDAEGVNAAMTGRQWSLLLLDSALGPEPAQFALDLAARTQPVMVRLLFEDAPRGDAGSARGAHQVLPRCAGAGQLVPVLEGALRVSATLTAHPRLASLVAKLDKVPSPPGLYFDLRRALEDDSADVQRIAEITARDPALVAQVLKLANSGFFGLPRTVADLNEAVGMVGTDALMMLVLAAHVFSGMPPPGMRLEVLWEHCLQVSMLARQIAAMEGAGRAEQSACAVAGMLHDLGLILLLENNGAGYQPLWRQAAADEAALAELERQTYGVTHGELGALVLQLWSLPGEVVDAVAATHRWDRPAPTLAARAVTTAEWLLDGNGLRGSADEDLPAFLGELTRERLQQFAEARDDIGSQVA